MFIEWRINTKCDREYQSFSYKLFIRYNSPNIVLFVSYVITEIELLIINDRRSLFGPKKMKQFEKTIIVRIDP